jgi:hypothetical protein
MRWGTERVVKLCSKTVSKLKLGWDMFKQFFGDILCVR